MQSHYSVIDVTIDRRTRDGASGRIILGVDDMPAGSIAYGPRGDRDALSLWSIDDTPADVSAFTVIGCRVALSRAWPDLIGPAHPIGTYNRDMRAFGLMTV
jgi:hypothetical protein